MSEKKKVIEIIREEDVGGYHLQKIEGYDYLNLQEPDFNIRAKKSIPLTMLGYR